MHFRRIVSWVESREASVTLGTVFYLQLQIYVQQHCLMGFYGLWAVL